MSPRLAPLLAAFIALLAAAACASSAGLSAPPSRAPGRSFAAVDVPPASLAPTATRSPDAGNVDGVSYPELSVERVGEETIQATIRDPAAKAWRLVIAGIGSRAGDRFELAVETGDVRPSITATEIGDDHVVGEMDLSAFADGTGAAGGCHRTLPVCVDSSGFRLPSDGDGAFSVRLTVTDPTVPMTVTGATATWPGEPFILGPWTSTEPFPWAQG